MNMKQSLILIVIGFLLCQAALAQNKSKLELVSEKVMSTEFQSLDESSPIKLSDYKGKIIVLALWASWCGPCRMAVTNLNEFHKDFAYRSVEVIGLSIENPKSDVENVRAFVHDSKLDFKLGWVNEEVAGELVGDKQIVPQILVFTDEGLIIKRLLGYNPNKTVEQLRDAVEQAFMSPPTKQ